MGKGAKTTTGRFRGRAAMAGMRREGERIAMRLRFAAQITTGRFRDPSFASISSSRPTVGSTARKWAAFAAHLSYFSFASARRAAARSVFSQEKAVALTVSPSPLR